MGYNLYITRKDEWFDEHGIEIELEDWIALVEADPELEMRDTATADVGDGQQLVAYDPTMAVWLDDKGNAQMWFYLNDGNVVGKNPRPPAIAKMHAIGTALDARLLGEEGEVYDAQGAATYPDFPDQEINKAETTSRPWWKFW